MEIERKFLMDNYPDLPYIDGYFVQQGYFSILPEVRIRSKAPMNNEASLTITAASTSYVLCIKGEGDLSRTELEWEITEPEFKALLEMIVQPMVTKLLRRYQLPNGLIAECSLVDPGTNHSFLYAEVEFATEDEAKQFVPPACFGRDITYDKAFKMKHYWEQTRVK